MDDFSLTLPEFDDHRIVSYIHDPYSHLEGFISIHRGSLNNPSFGATRIVTYKSKLDALRDSLRLARLMSYKAAMAGLKYGGAKGVIILPEKISDAARKALLKSYAQKVNYCNGHFITGADVGISDEDLKIMKLNSPYMVGINSDPVKFTALGLKYGIDTVMEYLYGDKTFSGRSIAIQGVGKVGGALLGLLYKQAKKIYIADTDIAQIRKIKRQYHKVEVVSPSQIYKQKVDVFSPCALGNALTAKTISKIKAPVILGGANNQLESPAVGEILHKLGIIYAPDYIVNAGGLISVVDEYENKRFDEKRISRRLNNIKVILRSVLKKSSEINRPTNRVSDEMAEKIFNK